MEGEQGVGKVEESTDKELRAEEFKVVGDKKNFGF